MSVDGPDAPWRTHLAALRPSDAFDATGPLLMAVVCAFVLYGIQVPVNFLVQHGVGLVWWPGYELAALLVERGLVAAFAAAQPETWARFRNGFFPLLLAVVLCGLYLAGQWFWLVVFAQLLSLLVAPPAAHRANEGCLHAAVTGALLFTVLVLAVFGVPESLSALFRFPHVTGELRYLPGMLIIGIGYYALMAGFVVLLKPLTRAA